MLSEGLSVTLSVHVAGRGGAGCYKTVKDLRRQVEDRNKELFDPGQCMKQRPQPQGHCMLPFRTLHMLRPHLSAFP
ncbi:hypothetical protein E2C01_042374 [Portunus trituberculatus]|uniref:Uncharacterized protein n=1 Tax=Portunus trituberculatus TaxID=210409 RepID=A0A5B7FTA7_PORTR|nr:hypothetical protein [Portunus trituberculatus]